MAVTLKKVAKWAQKKKVDKLLKALSNCDGDVRLAVIKALGETKDEGAMYQLISLLKDPDVSIRFAVVEALGCMGIGRSLEYVRQLGMIESDENVREKARWAMAAIKEASKDEKH